MILFLGTDREGRMVPANTLHCAVTRFEPMAMADLATPACSLMRGLATFSPCCSPAMTNWPTAC